MIFIISFTVLNCLCIVHVEADYLSPVKVGDLLEIHVEVKNLGNTSFTMAYKIFKANDVLMGKAKTVHVCLDAINRQKISIPDSFRKILQKYQHPENKYVKPLFSCPAPVCVPAPDLPS